MNKQSEKPRGLLSGKTVLLCVTGGIAAYKMPNVARMLKKLGCNVHVLMTQNATNFITATTFETLTANKCLIDTFDRNFEFSVEHVALAKQADLVLIAPATANVIGKIANGIADDMLTTTLSSTGLWTCFHWPVDVFPLACGRASTGQWTTPEGANLINALTAL